MSANWLDIHSGAIQAISTIVLVGVTFVLFLVTWTYAKAAKQQAEHAERLVEETQQQRFDQHRPVLHPSGTPPLTESGDVDWQPHCELRLQNVGSGVALIVCGVLFPPEPKQPGSWLPERYTIWRESSFLPGFEGQSVKLVKGITKMNGDATIGGGYQLFAPRKPTRQLPMGGQYNILARLTLTYKDIFMHKHGAVFDYIDPYGWQCVDLLSNIPKDLEDIDQEADNAMTESIARISVTESGPLLLSDDTPVVEEVFRALKGRSKTLAGQITRVK